MFGGEASGGPYITFGEEFDIGLFVSTGTPSDDFDYNFNLLSADIFIGQYPGSSTEFATPAENYNVVLTPASATRIDGGTGRYGGTVGLSIPLMPSGLVGFSNTSTDTYRPVSIRREYYRAREAMTDLMCSVSGNC